MIIGSPGIVKWPILAWKLWASLLISSGYLHHTRDIWVHRCSDLPLNKSDSVWQPMTSIRCWLTDCLVLCRKTSSLATPGLTPIQITLDEMLKLISSWKKWSFNEYPLCDLSCLLLPSAKCYTAISASAFQMFRCSIWHLGNIQPNWTMDAPQLIFFFKYQK